MYVDDRLGRRSRARSGLDQLDVAEDLFAVRVERPRALRPKRHKPLAAVPSFRELRLPARV